MALLGIAIGQSKQAYFLLPACYLLIPRDKLGSTRRYFLGFALVMVVTLLSVAAWGLVVRGIYSPANIEYGIDPRRQLVLIISDPRHFLLGVMDVLRQFPMYLCQYVGVLGWLDTRLPRWLLQAELVVMLFIFVSDFDSRVMFSTRQALLALVSPPSSVSPSSSSSTRHGNPSVPASFMFRDGISFRLAHSLDSPFHGLRARFRFSVPASPYLRPAALASIPCFLLLSSLCLHGRYFADGL